MAKNSSFHRNCHHRSCPLARTERAADTGSLQPGTNDCQRNYRNLSSSLPYPSFHSLFCLRQGLCSTEASPSLLPSSENRRMKTQAPRDLGARRKEATLIRPLFHVFPFSPGPPILFLPTQHLSQILHLLTFAAKPSSHHNHQHKIEPSALTSPIAVPEHTQTGCGGLQVDCRKHYPKMATL